MGDISPEDKRKVTGDRMRQSLGIFRFVLPYKWYFLIGMVFLALSTGSTLVFPYFLGQLVDVAVPSSPFSAAGSLSGGGGLGSIAKSNVTFIAPEKINRVALTLAAILAVQSVFSFLRIYLFSQVSEKAMRDIRLALYSKILTLPIPFFESRRVGELTSRISSDVTQLQDVISITLAEFLRAIVTLIIGVTILVTVVSGKLTIFMVATFPVMIIVALVFGKFIRKISKQAQDELANANVIVEETFQNVSVVKSFTNEPYEVAKYRTALNKVVDAALRAASYRGWFVSFIFMAIFGGIVLVIWKGAHMINDGEISVGDLISFMLYTAFIGGSVAGLGDLYGQLQKTLGASERIRDLMEENGEGINFDLNTPAVQRLKGDIHLQDVHFTYPSRTDMEVLQGINMDIKAGQKIALVGQSGAGKSTIAQLLLSFYPISSGKIDIDGKPASEYDLHTLRGNVGIVPQEVMLFGGSIRENIAYGKPNATDAEIIEAAKKANAWQFVEHFPEKLDTVVGERGVKLSGGQRQRIAIARAILKDPAILVLDEATSSLDAESEVLVQSALNELMKGRTTVIIAHRLSTIRQVDCIYVIDKGTIAEKGAHEELATRPEGLYAKLLTLSQWEIAG